MIAVLQKAFTILETLDESPRPLTLAAITKRVEQPKPTVLRILRTLGELGYAHQDTTTGDWSTTAALGELGRDRDDPEMTRRFRPLLQNLHARFNETVNLGVLEGLQVRYVEVLETSRPLRMIVRPGATDTAHSTALGRAIIAWRPLSERETVLANLKLAPRTDRTVTDRTKLAGLLDDARAQGWALDDEESMPGVVCMAVPLLQDGLAVAAISVTVPAIRATKARRKEIVAALLDTSRRG